MSAAHVWHYLGAVSGMMAQNRHPEGMTEPHSFLLQHARAFRSMPIDGADLAVVRRAAPRRLPMKQCFQNAARTVLNDMTGRLRYVEGFAHGIIPVHHAWVTLDGEALVDVTWNRERSTSQALASKVVGEFDEAEMGYVGVVFSTERLRRFILETETYGSLLFDYERGYPLLREAFDAAGERA